jgi:hypothetical protein
VNQLVDTIQDFYRKTFNKPATSAVLTHCKRELMQAIWLHLLDDDFVDAYANGTLVECVDGTVRRFFPRIFTYSADYPEKYEVILLLSSRHLICQQDPPRMYKDAREFSLPTVHDIKGHDRHTWYKIRHAKERKRQGSPHQQSPSQA